CHVVERAAEIADFVGDPSTRELVDTGTRREVARAEPLGRSGDMLERSRQTHRDTASNGTEDEERGQQRNDDPPRLRWLRPGPELESSDDLAVLEHGNASNAVLEDEPPGSRPPSWKHARIALHPDVESGRLTQLRDVGLGRSGVVPELRDALLYVTRHD